MVNTLTSDNFSAAAALKHNRCHSGIGANSLLKHCTITNFEQDIAENMVNLLFSTQTVSFPVFFHPGHRSRRFQLDFVLEVSPRFP
ncbi:hypothetical protein CDAR_187811 [Caerostris darwini]|uniref:Uncharacterized protein n=1 Tax=Caerostris darwini TaxID=1538125 RepID=A0AAV4N802_9ARAC|nr:hypothetical protein CDAR_187811 [Caerostris darwini]